MLKDRRAPKQSLGARSIYRTCIIGLFAIMGDHGQGFPLGRLLCHIHSDHFLFQIEWLESVEDLTSQGRPAMK